MGCSDWDTPELIARRIRGRSRTASWTMLRELEQFDLLAISQGAAVAVAYCRSIIRNGSGGLVITQRLCARLGVRAATRRRVARREAMLTLTELGWGADNPAYRQLFTNLYVPGANAQADGLVQRDAARLGVAGKCRSADAGACNDRRARTCSEQVRHSDPDVPCARRPGVHFIRAGRRLARGIPGSTFVPLDSRNHILLENEPAWRLFVEGSRAFFNADADVRPAVAKTAAPNVAEDEIRTCISADGMKIAYADDRIRLPAGESANWITNLHTRPHRIRRTATGSRKARGCSRFVRSDMRGFGQSDARPGQVRFRSHGRRPWRRDRRRRNRAVRPARRRSWRARLRSPMRRGTRSGFESWCS